MRVGEALSVVRRAGVLLLRHWPALVVLWLLGWLGSTEVTSLAVSASEVHDIAGVMVLALAPVSTMAAMVFMLRVLRTSSVHAAPAPVPGEHPRRVRLANALDSIGSLLIPFLAVYVAQGSLQRLAVSYYNGIAQDNANDALVSVVRDGGEIPDVLRRLPSSGVSMGLLFAVAFAVRWTLRRRARPGSLRAVGRAWLGAWVEAIWLMVAVLFVNQWRKRGWSWVETRRVVRGLGDVAGWLADATGALSQPIRDAWTEVTGAIGSLDKVVLAPLALLTIGAVVYGAEVRTPDPAPLPGESVVRSRFAASRLATRLGRTPTRVAKPAFVLARPLRARFQPLVDGLRLVAKAGLTPMILFCVAYVGTQVAADWSQLLWRHVIGPRQFATWYALDPVVSLATDLVAGIFGVALVAAAIERLIAATAAEPAPDPGPDPEPAPDPGPDPEPAPDPEPSAARSDQEVDGVIDVDLAEA